MSFGQTPYGTTPWGSAAIESGGITLVSATPAPNATAVAPNTSFSLRLNAPSEFDPGTIYLTFDGIQVIRDSGFVAPYSGTITFVDENASDLLITVTHPDFTIGNAVSVAFNALDLSSTLLAVSYTFNIAPGGVSSTETLTLSETLNLGGTITLSETMTIVEGISPFVANASDTLTLSEDVSVQFSMALASSETLTLFEGVQVGTLLSTSLDDTTVLLEFPEEVRLDGVSDIFNYSVEPIDGGVPILIESVTPVFNVDQTGSQGQVVAQQLDDNKSWLFDTYTGTFDPTFVGRYLFVLDTDEPDQRSFIGREYFRIESVSGTVLTTDKPLVTMDPSNGTYVPGTGFVPGTGNLYWAQTQAIKQVVLKTTEGTRGRQYQVTVKGIRRKSVNRYFTGRTVYVANSTKPQTASVQFLPDNGTVTVTFNEDMRIDDALLSPDEYTISGPTPVYIHEVRAIDMRTVALLTSGFGAGSYTLTVNAFGTPKDVAGNPMDPLFNQAAFTASVPLTTRSIFTDKGPIAKPSLTLFSGVGGTIQTTPTMYFGAVTLNEVLLPGGAFNSNHVGMYLTLGGTSVNGGSYKVTSVLSATRLRLEANLRLPDPSNGSLTWRLYNPRTGEVADDPSDVVVRVNGVPVIPDSVIGLLGQIVLPSAPSPTDDVKVDYSWISDPTIEIRRLNSHEFKLNGWTTDAGRQGPTQHTYRYRNVLITPTTFEPDDMEANQEQPLLRELHYRAFERAYSVALNDPNSLLLNTPIHRIAYPPLSRPIDEVSVSYAADTLPEADADPWTRQGLGLASVVAGNLVMQDNTDGPYPAGNPLFWVHPVDLTFPHVFAMTWRMLINSSTPDGVFTGISAGWSDDEKVALVGFLVEGGVRKVGFLKKGQGNDPSVAASWTGGLSSGSSTGLAATFDWSTLHSYRVLRDLDGVIRFYVDGDVVETLRVTSDELPYLSEINDPFDQVQGAFFGSLSREAKNVSTWDFVRYLVLPTNPQQTAPTIYVSYEGDEAPEESAAPWTPVGSHGNETISGSTLVLDSTSAAATTDAGILGGDFKGFTRIEPLLASSSDVVVDFGLQLRTYTHGVTQDAVTLAVDDGSRLVQVSFFPTKAQPKIGYAGRTLPENASPSPWAALGGQVGRMSGQTLVIEDTSISDGRVYAIEDLEPPTADTRVISVNNDYYIEFKLKIESYTSDGALENFCGATVDVFDGTRAIGLMARQTVGGTRRLAFHSDGFLLGGSSEFDFNWFDGSEHIVRMVKSTSGDLVSLFVDGSLLGTFAYSSFNMSVGNPTISFGSSTSASSGAKSVVSWHYVNVWRGQPTTGVRRYVGIWKGFDSNLLTGYHLPLKASGQAAKIAGNSFTDLTANFVAAGVSPGDDLVIDVGSNKGIYSVATVSATTLTITASFPAAPSEVGYRIPLQTDWTANHKYRLVREPGGSVSLLLDAISIPLIRVDYSATTLPASSLGFPAKASGGLPSVAWGAFDPTNLSQVAWDFVRYGVTNSAAVSKDRIVPHHQVLNQRNVMSSPEHLDTSVTHNHTQFSSSSTGVPYPWEQYVENPAVVAFTRLNEGTPLVPSTQTYEVRRPTPQVYFLSALNRPEDVLNGDGFLLNDASTEVRLIVPDDVLYNSLQVVEQTTGSTDFIAPFSDESNPISHKLNWTKEVCGTYAGNALPEFDSGFGSPWVIESDSPGAISRSIFNGVLTYSVSSGNTIYRNATPLTDPIGLNTEVSFTLRVNNDSTGGTGDTGVRFGFSAFGTITAALAFVSMPSGEREVRLLDLATEMVVGAVSFDFLDGLYHTYRLVKNIEDGTVDFLIDP